MLEGFGDEADSKKRDKLVAAARSSKFSLLTSRGSPSQMTVVRRMDKKWIVSGTESDQVTVWNAESRSEVTEFKAHDGWVIAVDISPGTKITSGSEDKTQFTFGRWATSSSRPRAPWVYELIR